MYMYVYVFVCIVYGVHVHVYIVDWLNFQHWAFHRNHGYYMYIVAWT